MPPLLSQVASVVTLQVPSEQQAPVTSTGRHWFTSAQVRPGVKRPPSVLQTIPVSGWHVPPMQHAPSGPSTPQRLSEQDAPSTKDFPKPSQPASMVSLQALIKPQHAPRGGRFRQDPISSQVISSIKFPKHNPEVVVEQPIRGLQQAPCGPVRAQVTRGTQGRGLQFPPLSTQIIKLSSVHSRPVQQAASALSVCSNPPTITNVIANKQVRRPSAHRIMTPPKIWSRSEA